MFGGYSVGDGIVMYKIIKDDEICLCMGVRFVFNNIG